MNTPKTVEALEAYSRTLGNDKPHSRRLGAGTVGDLCARKVWYGFRWAKAEKFEGRILRLFQRGHLEEQRFVQYLRGIGCEVWDKDAEGKQWVVTDHDGHFVGKVDAVARGLPDLPPGVPFLCEFKTHNHKSFTALVNNGVMASKFEHYVQAQLYMNKLALSVTLYMAVNKNDDDVYMELLYPDPDTVAKYMSRAHEIIYAEEPPLKVQPDASKYPCTFCTFKQICHYNEIPSINCRTCAHASVGPAGAWLCAKGRVEIAEQRGCPEHLFDPRFFSGFHVIGGSFDENYIDVYTGVETVRWGPKYTSSAQLQERGITPF